MKITKIKNKEFKKLPTETLEMIAEAINSKLSKSGYITEVKPTSGSSLNISSGRRCFSVNIDKHGHNAIVPYSSPNGYIIDSCGVKGYKLTNIPTWDQRVEFNNILNKTLDFYGVKAEIKAGPFIIRDYNENYTEIDWELLPEVQENWSHNFERIIRLSDEMVAEGKRRLKEHRKKVKKN